MQTYVLFLLLFHKNQVSENQNTIFKDLTDYFSTLPGSLSDVHPQQKSFHHTIFPAIVTEGISIGKNDAGTKQDLAKEDNVETVETYQDALQYVVSHMPVDISKRNILVAHQFVTGAARCESEEVSVGGLDQIEAHFFSDCCPFFIQ
jgi:hypothetical protein